MSKTMTFFDNSKYKQELYSEYIDECRGNDVKPIYDFRERYTNDIRYDCDYVKVGGEDGETYLFIDVDDEIIFSIEPSDEARRAVEQYFGIEKHFDEVDAIMGDGVCKNTDDGNIVIKYRGGAGYTYDFAIYKDEYL